MTDDSEDLTVDVVVVGGGNAGLCAALSALESNAQVIVLERSPREHRGGNSQYVTRYRFAYTSLEEIVALTDVDEETAKRLHVEPYSADRYYQDLIAISSGRADPSLARVLADESYDTIKWLVEHGMRFKPMFEAAKERDGKFVWDPGRMLRPIDRGTEIVRALYTAVGNKGGEVIYDAHVVDLITEGPGAAIEGVIVRTPIGIQRIRASAVILASGGFQASSERRSRYLGGAWGTSKVRGTRYNTGELLDVALRHGAGSAGEYGGAHATMVHASAPPIEMGDEVSFPHGYPFSLMVNIHGERFVDEGASFYASTYARYGHDVLAQPSGVAFQVFDRVSSPWKEKTGERRYAVDTITADSIEELAEKAGIDAEGLVSTVREYNAAIQPGTFDPAILDGLRTKGLHLEKTNWALPLEEPPFEAFRVECGLTFTFGGLATDTHGQVLDSVGVPIAGLYAVGEIAGTFFKNYVGGSGMMKGAVFGRRAGLHAASAVLGPNK